MKTLDRVVIPAHEDVMPSLWDTVWNILAWHETKGERMLWLFRPQDGAYCMVRARYAQLLS